VRPAGSKGREAFATALEVLAGYRPDRPGQPPRYQYAVPGEGRTGPALPAPSGPAVSRPGTIPAAAAALRAGRVTCTDLVEEALLAVDKFDGELNGVAHLMAESARAEAATLDEEAAAGRWRGPLHGIPITVKDIIDVRGAPTCAGSAAYHDLPAADAVAVARARAAGAVVLAKVTTHEFALGVTSPQSRNPHDPTRIPGGSSGGSAVAVSTGMGLGSIGTDTRASIRVPAALSGVVGFKPTFGSVPTAGVVPLSWTMDHVAPMATTVEDAALLLDALRAGTGAPLASWAGAPIAGLRIGVPESTFEGAADEVATAVRVALSRLERRGCVLLASDRPRAEDLEAANAAGLVVSRCEAAAFHRALGADRSLYWEEVADQLDAADGVRAVDYIDAQRLRADLAESLLGVFDDVDLLAMPTAPIVAPPVDDFARHLLLLSRNAIAWSLIGFPAVSVPCGRPGRLPVGIQLVAPPWREDLLVAAGTALEGARRD
jgi:aspartyl-tRNA(Asn)/glutamyl-tRNA(Gln) amidotransferase subunit A